MESLIKALSGFIPFLNPYPIWVKLAVGAFILTGAISLVGLIIAAPSGEVQADQPGKAWLIIKRVTMFNGGSDGVRVTASVNGAKFIYPTLDGISWLQPGPSMSAQTFQIPVEESYDVKFSMETKEGQARFASVETQHLTGNSHGTKTYNLHQVDAGGTRGAPITVQIDYEIKAD